MDDLLNEYIEKNRMYHFDGESGLQSLNKLCDAIGYEETPYRYGSSLETFLGDNPGCIGAMIEWMNEQLDGCPEWQQSLKDKMEENDYV
jgi:hypothetical protein